MVDLPNIIPEPPGEDCPKALLAAGAKESGGAAWKGVGEVAAPKGLGAAVPPKEVLPPKAGC